MMAGVCGLIDHLRFLGHALQPEPTLGDQPNTYTAPHVQINLKLMCIDIRFLASESVGLCLG